MESVTLPEDGHSRTKRRRTDEGEDGDHSTIRKSTEFWFEDGTLVVRTSHLQFRVHRGTLAIHSEFFRNMFDLPQPEDQETVEGAPVVDVTDKIVDWVALLKMIYRPLETMQNVDNLPYSFVASIVRLGKKYEFTTIAKTGLDQLKKMLKDPQACMATGSFGKMLPVITLVEELQIDILRPSLYYWCIRNLTLPHIAHGIPRGINCLPHSFSGAILAHRDTVRMSLITHVWVPFLEGKTPPCYNPACTSAIKSHAIKLITTPVKHHLLEHHSIPGVCANCKLESSKMITSGRNAFFKQLPLCFGMKDFDQLQDYAA